METKLLLRPAEAADRLSVSRTKIYLLLASGEVPSVRVGGSLRVPADALEKYVQKCAQAAAREPATT